MTSPFTRFLAATESEDRSERTLQIAAALCEALTAAGSHPVLVGGGAVEIYTRSAYTTRDLGFVAAVTDELGNTMLQLGFEREGRHWVHEQLGVVVGFPGTTLGDAEAVSIDVDGAELRIISVEDLIVDRLASWKHWGWGPDGAAAVILMAIHTDLDADRLWQRGAQEEVADAMERLQPLARGNAPVTEQQLRRLRLELE